MNGDVYRYQIERYIEEGNHEKARSLLEELSMHSEVAFESGPGDVRMHINLAECILRDDSAAYPKAMIHLRTALRTAARIEDTESCKVALEKLMQLHSLYGDYHQASEYRTLYQQLLSCDQRYDTEEIVEEITRFLPHEFEDFA